MRIFNTLYFTDTETTKNLSTTVSSITNSLTRSSHVRSSSSSLTSEKVELQKQLLKLEKLHGRPETCEEKEICRDLYERYREVKRALDGKLGTVGEELGCHGDEKGEELEEMESFTNLDL